ncbi:MAG: restriction endonuclease [Chloroflexota bacterium]|nr:restriction endonuclease [Chloroflexota bacterium]
MSKLDDFIGRTLMAAVARLSDRGVVALAFGLYAGGGLALPLALRWSVLGLVIANFLSTSLAGMVLLLWLAAQVQASHRRLLVEWTTDLRLLTAEEFEWLVGEMLRREGWQVRETGRKDGPDGNIDLELTRDGQRAIAQCKRWVSWPVGIDEIRKFAGTLMSEGLPGSAGIFVTLSDFTGQARVEAQRNKMALVDNHDLYARVEKVRRAEPCRICSTPMVLNRSTRGWWLRCVAPGCQGKRDLGSEPGRAVDLLTRTT